MQGVVLERVNQTALLGIARGRQARAGAAAAAGRAHAGRRFDCPLCAPSAAIPCPAAYTSLPAKPCTGQFTLQLTLLRAGWRRRPPAAQAPHANNRALPAAAMARAMACATACAMVKLGSKARLAGTQECGEGSRSWAERWQKGGGLLPGRVNQNTRRVNNRGEGERGGGVSRVSGLLTQAPRRARERRESGRRQGVQGCRAGCCCRRRPPAAAGCRRLVPAGACVTPAASQRQASLTSARRMVLRAHLRVAWIIHSPGPSTTSACSIWMFLKPAVSLRRAITASRFSS